MALVDVYVGSNAWFAPAVKPFIVAGGYWPYVAIEEAAMVPAPAPPVCHDVYCPSKGCCEAPRASHVPIAIRGSVGIHPFCSPSWYDQRGASTEFVVDELPTYPPAVNDGTSGDDGGHKHTFQVQKYQC